nr:molybdate ABC transporter substrate-binding protein [Cohnella sp. YIM B05605]
MAGCNADSKTQPSGENVELTVSAAASLTDALEEIGKAYESGHPSVKLDFNFGSSGALQQQIEQGAPADLFLSASPKNMNALVEKQLIDPERHAAMLAGELVVVVPAGGQVPISGLADLTKDGVRHVAIGIPGSVPAGSYAKEALENAKLWDSLQAKTVQGKDVRQVLQYVETENADAGFVYKTDALASSKVKIAFSVDPGTYSPIEYPAGIVKSTKHPEEAEDFYDYLRSDEAFGVFARYGFAKPGLR